MTLRKFTKKIKNNIKKYLVNGFLILLLFFTGVFANYISYPLRYNYAKKEYKKENYEKSAKIFKKIAKYKDAYKRYEDSKHKNDIKNDKIPPTISMLSNELTLEQGQDFNSKQFISDNLIRGEDNISKIVDLNIDSSNLDINNPGQYDIIIEAIDESGNVSYEKIIVNVIKNSKSEEITAFVNNNLPEVEGVKSVEYDENGKTVIIKIEHENIKEVAYASKESLYVKTVWARLTDSINNYCENIYNSLINNNYEIEAVSVYISESNDLLFISINGITFMDVSEL
ncbi:hypothetical protein C824_001471 [Schaedlerella arabinosiphila]|nr:hypothetical protein C824_001471 [Schaedlerella arabinosiphila]